MQHLSRTTSHYGAVRHIMASPCRCVGTNRPPKATGGITAAASARESASTTAPVVRGVAAARGRTVAAATLASSSHLCSIGGGGEVSGSIVRSVLGAVKQGISAVSRVLLPPSLQRALDGERNDSLAISYCSFTKALYGFLRVFYAWLSECTLSI